MRVISIILASLFVTSLAYGAPSKGKDKDDYVKLRISAHVMGQFTGNSHRDFEDPDGKNTGSHTSTYKDTYTTSYEAVTKWKVKDIDQHDDILSLELVSYRPIVDGSGGGMMKGVKKTLVYGPYVKGKRDEYWQTETVTSNWNYRFPQDSKPMSARVRLNKRAKTFRIVLNGVGPGMPEIEGQTTMVFDSKDRSDTKTFDAPMAACIGGPLCTMCEIAAIPMDETDKRLTGTFNPDKPFAVSGGAVFNASEARLYKQVMDNLAVGLGEGGSVHGDGKLFVSYTLAWNCEPAELEAIITPKDGLESWLPAASTSEDKPGNTVGFEIRLIDKKTGKEPENKTAYFKCDLSDVSKEPGSCMNSISNGTEPDLKFLSSDNPDMETVSGDGKSATSKKELKKCSLSVSCYDGGAYGKLRVMAYLNDGRTVMAHLEGKSEGMDVAIPFDENSNHIADSWEDSNGMKGDSPSSDDDEQPLGDHDNGDGLTVWEEYRGFMEAGKHFRTDPQKKDFFIYDTIGGKCKKAIDRFALLTKLEVHDKLTAEEMSESHVINRNHSGDAPHVVDQHGIVIATWSTKGVCEAQGGPGTPKSITQVLIDSTLSDTVTKKLKGGTTKTYEYYEHTVAHELLHCCNVWHHGDEDEKVYWQASTVDGSTEIYEYGSKADCGHPEKGDKILVFNEDTGDKFVPTDPVWSSPLSIWFGRHQGQHSGNEDCVMRYDCSWAYTPPDVPIMRYCLIWNSQEPVGTGLCTSSKGTGVNESGRSPFIRYGDAAGDRGDCSDKFCVNDLFH